MAESARDIKRRIKSVKNIAQITKAMEAVSANKMRKSQGFALDARGYAVAALKMLENLLLRTRELPEILKGRDVKKKLLLVVTADKGLAGAYNSNVLKQAEKWIKDHKKAGIDFSVVTVGKKAKEYLGKRAHVIKSFVGFSDFSKLNQTNPVADAVTGGFMKADWDEVQAVYTQFRTTLKQEVVTRKILPATKEGITEMVEGILPEYGKFAPKGEQNIHAKIKYVSEYIYEPDINTILNSLVPRLLHMHIHHIILEANASEHSSRMVAMKNASDNARDLIGGLTLKYNKVRQAGITREIIEITAGSEALKQ